MGKKKNKKFINKLLNKTRKLENQLANTEKIIIIKRDISEDIDKFNKKNLINKAKKGIIKGTIKLILTRIIVYLAIALGIKELSLFSYDSVLNILDFMLEFF